MIGTKLAKKKKKVIKDAPAPATATAHVELVSGTGKLSWNITNMSFSFGVQPSNTVTGSLVIGGDWSADLRIPPEILNPEYFMPCYC